jgi:hypothetical protein
LRSLKGVGTDDRRRMRCPRYVVDGASRSASASSSLNWISGDVISNGRKLCALIESSREGAVSVTVAVRGRRRMSASRHAV